jgi:hypothetical protein
MIKSAENYLVETIIQSDFVEWNDKLIDNRKYKMEAAKIILLTKEIATSDVAKLLDKQPIKL